MAERDLLQAQTAEESLHQVEIAAHLRREWYEDMTSHILALLLASGFFMLALFVLLGKVKIEEAPVATMVGTVIGIAATKLDPILFRYFKATPAPQKEKEAPLLRSAVTPKKDEEVKP